MQHPLGDATVDLRLSRFESHLGGFLVAAANCQLDLLHEGADAAHPRTIDGSAFCVAADPLFGGLVIGHIRSRWKTVVSAGDILSSALVVKRSKRWDSANTPAPPPSSATAISSAPWLRDRASPPDRSANPPGQNPIQRCAPCGLRFSEKAAMPSRRSSRAKVEWNRRRSKRTPSLRVVS